VPGVPVGDPFDPATVVGPMAGGAAPAKVEEYVRRARAEGGRVVAGGGGCPATATSTSRPSSPGWPTTPGVVQEEIFGPVLTVQPFDTEDEAVALANGTAYGLAAGLHTNDVARAHRVAARLEAGIVWVNDWAMLDPAMPFGGVKQSGYGRENGPEALESYTRTKSVLISLEASA
jgi:phenylacetaldehyde dehydrogenase